MELIKGITTNILTAFYEPFGFALLLAIFFMFSYLISKEIGWKETIKKWTITFKNDAQFRKLFLLAFYIAMMLFRTLLNRQLWLNPLSNVMGGWGLYDDKGNFTTESIENIILFIPFILLLFIYQHKKNRILLHSIQYSFLFSLCIEMSQLLLRVGTFQFADLFYNTSGGLLGGILYLLICKVSDR